MNMSLKESTLSALKAMGTWSSAKEVYNYMVANGFDVGNSKTPADSVSAVLVRGHGEGLLLYRKRTKTLGEYGCPEWNDEKPEEVPQAKKEDIAERDLHQLLCNYLWANNEYPMTIYQERSNRNDTAQKWVHPDMVSASFVSMKKPMAEELLKATNANEAMQLCSYELKIRIRTDYELKQAYFQALSNSNWANYGYLVAFEFADNKDLFEEMQRLNQSFGIGIIQLGVTPDKTKVIFPARKNELDYKTIDKLCDINKDFLKFVEQVTKVLTAEKRYLTDVKNTLKNICDPRIEDWNKIKAYCLSKNIPTES